MLKTSVFTVRDFENVNFLMRILRFSTLPLPRDPRHMARVSVHSPLRSRVLNKHVISVHTDKAQSWARVLEKYHESFLGRTML